MNTEQHNKSFRGTMPIPVLLHDDPQQVITIHGPGAEGLGVVPQVLDQTSAPYLVTNPNTTVVTAENSLASGAAPRFADLGQSPNQVISGGTDLEGNLNYSTLASQSSSKTPPPVKRPSWKVFASMTGLFLMLLAFMGTVWLMNRHPANPVNNGLTSQAALLSVGKDQTLGIKGNLGVSQAASVQVLTVSGQATIGQGLIVAGDASFSGTVKASFFVGDGSQLTNLPIPAIPNVPDNIVLLSPGSPQSGDISVSGIIAAGGIQGSGASITTITSTSVIANSFIQNGNIVCDITNNCGFGGGVNGFNNGGNTFGVVTSLGTNDNFALNLRTNGVTRFTLDTSGNSNLTGTAVATAFSGDGSALTSLNATNLQSGTVNDARLSSNVPLKGGANTFTALNNFTGGLQTNGNTVCDTSGNCAASGNAGGDLTGTFPNPTIAKLQGTTLTIAGLSSANFLQYNGTNWVNQSLSGDILVNNAGVAAIQANSVTLTTDTSGDYVANLGSLTGLTTSANSGEGSVPTLSVTYGSGANTAVQGNVSLACAGGTGNLTGGGNSITLGTGGSCNNLSTVNNPTFSTSVTTPLMIFTGAGSNGLLQVANLGQTTTYTLPDPGGASASICLTTGNCAGAGAGVTTPGGTTGAIAKFTGSQALGNSTLSESGSTLIASGTLVVQGTSAITLGTASGNTGAILLKNSSNANTLTLQSGASGSNFSLTLPTTGGSNGDCLQSSGGGVLVFSACTGGAGGGVTSVDGQIGVVALDNASGLGGTITIDNAAADGVTKGIATFNSTNFSDGSGVVNTIQNINSAATPTFAAASLTNASSLTLGLASTNTGSVLFKGSGSANTLTLLGPTTPGTNTLTLPNETGTICSTGAVCSGYQATIANYIASLGVLTGLSTTGNSGAGSTPTLSVLYGAIPNTAVQGDVTLTCPSAFGNASLSGTGNTITLGTGGSCSAISLSSTPSFSSASLTGASALTLGTATTNTGSILFKGAGSANTLTLNGPTSPSTNTLSLPNETGTLCSTGSICAGYAPSSGSTTYFSQGGNSFTAQAVLGTNDANSLALRTNGTNRLVVDTSGNLTFQQASTLSTGANTLTVTSSNINVASTGKVTLQGGLAQDIATADAAVANDITIKPGASSGGAGGAVVIRGSNGSTSGGGITIDAGTGPSTNGFITIGASSPLVTLGWSSLTQLVLNSISNTIDIGQYSSLIFGNTINVGSLNAQGTNVVNIGGGTITSGTKTVNIANGTPAAGSSNTVAIGTGGSTTGTVGITIGSNAAAGHTTLIQGGNGATAIQLTQGAGGTITAGSTSGASAVTVQCGTGTCTFGGTSTDHTTLLGSFTGTSATTIVAGTGGINIGATSSVANTIQIGLGATSIFAVAQSVNIGNNAAGTDTVLIGNLLSTSSTTLQGGTGASAVIIKAGSAGTISIGNSGVGNAIQIGTTSGAVTQTIAIGNNGTASSTSTLTVGSLITASTTNIQGGTGTTAIRLDTGAGGGIQIANNSTSNNVTVGNILSTSATTIQGGTGASAVGIQAGSAGTISIATANNNTLNIGTATTSGTITIGGTAQSAATTIRGGFTGGLTLTTIATAGGSSGAVTLQSGDNNNSLITGTGAVNIKSGSTSVAGAVVGDVNIDTGTPGGTAVAGSLNIGTGSFSHSVVIGNVQTSSSVSISGGSGGSAINLQTSSGGLNLNSTSNGAVNIGTATLTSSTQTISIGTGTSSTSGGKVVNIATGVPGTSTTNTVAIGNGGTTTGTVGVTIGSIGAAAHTTLIQGGNGGSAVSVQAAASGTISIGTTNSNTLIFGSTGQTGSITLGQSTDTMTINIGTGATASGKTLTVHIGDAGVAGSTTNITIGSAIAGTLTVQSAAIFNKDVTFNGHIISNGSSVTKTDGAAACTTPTITVTGNDTAGTISVLTGTGCGATGTFVTVNFATAYGAAPKVSITPTNAAASGLKYYAGNNASASFTLDTDTSPANTTTYTYNYLAIK